MRVVKELEAIEDASAIFPRRRIVVLQRDDGHFTFAEQYYYKSEYDGEIIAQGWATVALDGVHATAKIAETEGRAAFASWYRPIGE